MAPNLVKAASQEQLVAAILARVAALVWGGICLTTWRWARGGLRGQTSLFGAVAKIMQDGRGLSHSPHEIVDQTPPPTPQAEGIASKNDGKNQAKNDGTNQAKNDINQTKMMENTTFPRGCARSAHPLGKIRFSIIVGRFFCHLLRDFVRHLLHDFFRHFLRDFLRH